MHVVGYGTVRGVSCGWMRNCARSFMWLDAELCEEFHSAYGWMRNCVRSFIVHIVGCGTARGVS